MSIYPTTIAKAQQLIQSSSAALLYVWMLADDMESYTQDDVVQRYGLNKRSVRNLLYQLIDQGLIKREDNPGSAPNYYPQKRHNRIANEPTHAD